MDSLLIQLRQLKLAAMASALEQQRLAPHTYAELSFDEKKQYRTPKIFYICGCQISSGGLTRIFKR